MAWILGHAWDATPRLGHFVLWQSVGLTFVQRQPRDGFDGQLMLILTPISPGDTPLPERDNEGIKEVPSVVRNYFSVVNKR